MTLAKTSVPGPMCLATDKERVDVVGEGLGRLFRFLFLTKEPEVSPDASRVADERYRTLVASLARAVATGTTLVAAVRRARFGEGAPAPGSVAKGAAVGGGRAP